MRRSLIGMRRISFKIEKRKIPAGPQHLAEMQIAVDADASGGEALHRPSIAIMLEDDRFQFEDALGDGYQIRRQGFDLFPQPPQVLQGQGTHGLEQAAQILRGHRFDRKFAARLAGRQREMEFGRAHAEQARGFKIRSRLIRNFSGRSRRQMPLRDSATTRHNNARWHPA